MYECDEKANKQKNKRINLSLQPIESTGMNKTSLGVGKPTKDPVDKASIKNLSITSK